jgi:hypothetical protein
MKGEAWKKEQKKHICVIEFDCEGWWGNRDCVYTGLRMREKQK